MWRQAKVTVGDETADQAMVDFEGRQPVALEWPIPLALNAEIKIGEQTYFADLAQACAGKFHTRLMPVPLLPTVQEQSPAPPAETPMRKGKKP
jgi:hypothetical protein